MRCAEIANGGVAAKQHIVAIASGEVVASRAAAQTIIAAIAARAHAAGAMVIADNTTMTPLLQRPLDLGADLVVAADTKAPAGHSDALFGHVAGRDANLMARIREGRRQSGSVPGPFEAYLVHRGIETLEVRMARMCARCSSSRAPSMSPSRSSLLR